LEKNIAEKLEEAKLHQKSYIPIAQTARNYNVSKKVLLGIVRMVARRATKKLKPPYFNSKVRSNLP